MIEESGNNRQQPLSFTVHLDQPFARALESVTGALKEEGFGVLSRIDVKSALKEKLNEDFRHYTILGACNPPLAHRALTNNAEVGLMLPCNVTVEEDLSGGSIVRIIDPAVILEVGELSKNNVLIEVASEAREKLKRVAESLSA